MRLKKSLLALSVLIVVAFMSVSCEEEVSPEPPTTPPPAISTDDTVTDLPDGRFFHLGFNPWPYDFTDEALDNTYAFVNAHSDLILHHLDWGIPWPEAYAGEAYHPNVEADLNRRIQERQPGQKLVLAIAPQASERYELAEYWGEDWYLERPGQWADRTFDDPEVIEAYLNYARYLIHRFQPNYFNYAIEATDSFEQNDPRFDRFLTFAEQVYTTLKQENPDLPIFVSISTFSFEEGEEATRMALAKRIMPFTDFVAISTYPYYVTPPGNSDHANPEALPRDWFSRWAALAPEKPFAIAETAFPAEDVALGLFVNIEGRSEWQAAYLNWMFNELNALDAEFVSWFVSRDYDQGWVLLEEWGSEEFTKFWKDTGLLDGDGGERPSLTVWDAWLALPISHTSANSDPQHGRILSLDVTEAADGNFDAAFNLAKSIGMQATSLSVYWDEIETAPGIYNPEPNWLEIANLYYPGQDVQVSLAISVIDTNNLRLPPDLADKPFDDPMVIERFNGLLDYIATQIPDLTINSLAIGNEIDIYLANNARQWEAYETFFIAAASHARTLWPAVPVGSKITFNGISSSPAPYIQSLNQHSDAILVTYYPLESDFTVREPTAVHADFHTLTQAFPNQPVHLLEVGYPSGEVNNSSEEKQRDFIHELFLAWDEHAGQIPLVNYTWQTDVSPDAVEQMTNYYQLDHPAFVSYLATLGLRTFDNIDKPAFRQLAIETEVRGW